MEQLKPALLAVHFFGMALWLGGTISQYLFIAHPTKDTTDNWCQFNLFLIRKSFYYMIWPGIILMILTGVVMILMQGWTWFSGQLFLFLKMIITILLMVPVHVLWKKYKMLQSFSAPADKEILQDPFNQNMIRIKNNLSVVLIGLAMNILIGVYRFNF